MLTSEWFEQSALRLGFDVSTIDMNTLLQKHSEQVEHNHLQSVLISSTLKRYKLPFSPILDGSAEFFISTASTREEIFIPENVVTQELFDASSVTFVQTAQVAIDPAKGVYQLLTNLADGEKLIMVAQLVDESAVLSDLAFSKDMMNPITEYEKGPIKVKTRSLLETMLMQDQLAGRSGQNIVQIDVTRYSNGIVKGKRDGI